MNFSNYPDLASEANGGKIIFATDDFFAVAENMILPSQPVFEVEKYTLFGKEMDGWETRRKRSLGHDFSIIQLGLTGSIQGFLIDTGFFTGNQAPKVSIQAATLSPSDVTVKRKGQLGSSASIQEYQAISKLESEKWTVVLETVSLKPGNPDTRYHYFNALDNPNTNQKRWTHIRVNLFPDGGIARLRVYGTVLKDWSCIDALQVIDLASLENGARAIQWTNAHYGHPMNLLAPGDSKRMDQGWETARNPNRPSVYEMGHDGHLIIPGNESAEIVLGSPGILSRIQIDTHHYKGNNPESCKVLGRISGMSETDYVELVPRVKLGPHESRSFQVEQIHPISHVKLIMYPDGGISRLRVYGTIKLE